MPRNHGKDSSELTVAVCECAGQSPRVRSRPSAHHPSHGARSLPSSRQTYRPCGVERQLVALLQLEEDCHQGWQWANGFFPLVRGCMRSV